MPQLETLVIMDIELGKEVLAGIKHLTNLQKFGLCDMSKKLISELDREVQDGNYWKIAHIPEVMIWDTKHGRRQVKYLTTINIVIRQCQESPSLRAQEEPVLFVHPLPHPWCLYLLLSSAFSELQSFSGSPSSRQGWSDLIRVPASNSKSSTNFVASFLI
ncbi:hypothetical protein ACSBR2_014141 [Camellia fascicularis]